jgi:hypothetical protein
MNQPYTVIRPFKATQPISGREQWFQAGDEVTLAPDQAGPTVTIEVGGTFYLVSWSTFTSCCKFMKYQYS